MTEASAASPRVAIVVHATVPQDPRVRRQTDALVDAGYEVDIFALRDAGQATRESSGGVTIHRLPVNRTWYGMAGHLAEYLAFLAVATIVVTREHRRRRYRLVQVATVPDFLVAAGLPLKLTGVPVLLDLHEDMPTFYRDRFPGRLARPALWLVDGASRASAAVADELITVHEPLRQLSIARGVQPERIGVVMNSADERIFARLPRRRFMEDGVLRLVHHSNLQRVYGLEHAIEAVALLGDLPLRLDVYGDGPYRRPIEAAIRRTGTAERVTLHGRVPLERLPGLLAASDVGIVPTLPEPYAEYSLSTKLLEDVVMGVPVLATDLATFRYHFSADAIRYVRGADPAAMADAIRDDVAHPAAVEARAGEALRQYGPYRWDVQRGRYLETVDRLVAGAGSTAGRRATRGAVTEPSPSRNQNG